MLQHHSRSVLGSWSVLGIYSDTFGFCVHMILPQEPAEGHLHLERFQTFVCVFAIVVVIIALGSIGRPADRGMFV